MVEDYELIPHKVLRELRDEVEALKEKLGQPETPSHHLIEGMKELKTSIETMEQVFTTAIDYMKQDEEGYAIGKTIQKIVDKLEEIEVQNKQIAKGIVTVADMIEESHLKPSQPSFSEPIRPMAPRPEVPLRATSPSMGRTPVPVASPPAPLETPPPPPPPGMRPPAPAPPPQPGKKPLFDQLFKK